MKIFVDSSSLVKKYNLEAGSAELQAILQQCSELWVSHITYIETLNAVFRRYHQNLIIKKNFDEAVKTLNLDFTFFSARKWDEELTNGCVKIISRYQVKSLDAIQLASGISISPDLFVTSDKQQYTIANKEFRKAVLIK